MARKMSAIEKMTQHLMTVEMYQAKCLIAGRKTSSRTIRNRIDQIVAGSMTEEEAGFTLHVIADKYFIEDTSVAPAGQPLTY